MRILRRLLIGALALTAVIAAPYGYDVYQDRQHTIEFGRPTPLLSGSSQDNCDSRGLMPIAIIQPGDDYEVRRIRYWKECMTVEVRSRDHRLAGFVIQESGFTVHPKYILLHVQAGGAISRSEGGSGRWP